MVVDSISMRMMMMVTAKLSMMIQTKAIVPGPKLFLDGSQFMNPTKSDFCLAFMVPQFPDPSQQPAKKDVLLCTSVKSLIAHLVLKQVLLIIVPCFNLCC